MRGEGGILYQADLLDSSSRSAGRPAMRSRVSAEKFKFARALRKRSTPAEQVLWTYLRCRQLLGAKFRQQAIIFGWIVDFYCPEVRLVVEVDGRIHDHQQQADLRRNHVMVNAGFSVIRVVNELVIAEPQRVTRQIGEAIQYCRGGRL